MIEWHFFDKVLRTWLVVIVGGSKADFLAFMDDRGYKETDAIREGSESGWCIYLNSENNDAGNYCAVIWLRKFETACLVHELAHLVMMIFEDKGIPIRQENTEIFSYYQEFWFNEVMRARRKKPQGIKPTEVVR